MTPAMHHEDPQAVASFGFDPDQCPACEAQHTVQRETRMDEAGSYAEAHCTACHLVWIEEDDE